MTTRFDDDLRKIMSTIWQNELDQAIDRRFTQMVEMRRHIHSHPELSGQERETSLYLYQRLGNEGFDVRMGPEGRGVVADAPADSDNQPRIAIRADIDALRIHDAKQVEYRSRNDGVMHACGHDAHTAVVYGAVGALNDLRRDGRLPWDVPTRGIFQPAEETSEGARQMIEVGALDGIGAIIAAHVDPSRQVGHIGVRPGVLTASCDEMDITIVGRGGHAARPHEASDPIAAAAQLINGLYLFIPRRTDSQDAVVVTIGQIDGGDNANVIPEQVKLRGTVRTLNADVRKQTFEHIRRLSHSIGETTDTKIEVKFALGSPSVVNDKLLIELLRYAGRDVVGEEGVDEIPRPSMGSEDFSYYLERISGAMMRLGCTSKKAGGSPLHSPTFDVDEEALRIGARILARTAVYWSDPNRTSSANGGEQKMGVEFSI